MIKVHAFIQLNPSIIFFTFSCNPHAFQIVLFMLLIYSFILLDLVLIILQLSLGLVKWVIRVLELVNQCVIIKLFFNKRVPSINFRSTLDQALRYQVTEAIRLIVLFHWSERYAILTESAGLGLWTAFRNILTRLARLVALNLCSLLLSLPDGRCKPTGVSLYVNNGLVKTLPNGVFLRHILRLEALKTLYLRCELWLDWN